MKLVFATHNQHKLQELKMLLPTSIDLVSLNDINCLEDIAETGQTLSENALIKSTFIYEKYTLNCFADDSGLEVEALNGAPGVYSARYAGEPKNDENNMKKLLQELKSYPNRNACFKTVISLVLNDEKYFFEGIIRGQITQQKQGTQGFGYDPVFMPNGYAKTFAEMSASEKNAISHRALAVNKLVDFLLVNTK